MVFSDPLTSSSWLEATLGHWTDQAIASKRRKSQKSLLFKGMSPAEAELAFDLTGLPFHNYMRIAVVQNPFRRMTRLYDRIAATDPLWRLRRCAGRANPDFCRWLENTRPDGAGAAFPVGPRWRRFGAWSADAWADGRITHFVRAEHLAADLRYVFRELDVPPFIAAQGERTGTLHPAELLRYDAYTMGIIRDRYRSDLMLYQNAGDQFRLVA